MSLNMGRALYSLSESSYHCENNHLKQHVCFFPLHIPLDVVIVIIQASNCNGMQCNHCLF